MIKKKIENRKCCLCSDKPSLERVEETTKELLKAQAEMIFKEIDRDFSIEIKRLKKFDEDNWKKGNKEDGRKSTASILTLGINARNIINKIKKKWVKK